MDNAVIIGNGMVGKATAHALSIDKYFDLKESNVSLEQAAEIRYHFICLPTPTEKGRCNTDDILATIKQIRDYAKGQNVFIVRSTVTPGTCRSFMDKLGIRSIVHVPEFLSEDTWKKDAENPGIIVVGADSKNFRDDVAGIFRARYPRSVEIIKTDTITSEMTKWAINGFYTTKVVYANEIYDYAQKIGANYGVIKDAMYQRKWIGKNHLDVWHKDKRGAGGRCLPKDMEAMAEASLSPLLKKVKERNEYYLGQKRSD